MVSQGIADLLACHQLPPKAVALNGESVSSESWLGHGHPDRVNRGCSLSPAQGSLVGVAEVPEPGFHRLTLLDSAHLADLLGSSGQGELQTFRMRNRLQTSGRRRRVTTWLMVSLG